MKWILVIPTALLVSCATMSVRSDFDSTIDFGRYRTYGWMERPSSISNTLVGKRVKGSVGSRLGVMGYGMSDSPDFLVVLHGGVREQIDVTDWGYTRRRGREIDVHRYEEGTLVIDVVDAESRALVWRGSAVGVVGSKVSQSRIDEAVDKILEGFPPDRASSAEEQMTNMDNHGIPVANRK